MVLIAVFRFCTQTDVASSSQMGKIEGFLPQRICGIVALLPLSNTNKNSANGSAKINKTLIFRMVGEVLAELSYECEILTVYWTFVVVHVM